MSGAVLPRAGSPIAIYARCSTDRQRLERAKGSDQRRRDPQKRDSAELAKVIDELLLQRWRKQRK